jgi:tetratricopeptide (TPR) repeat protein
MTMSVNAPKDKQKWILRIANSPTQGPFSTAKVIQKINDGELLGEEMIAVFPDGQWRRLSQEQTFFSHILEVLEKSSDDYAAQKKQVHQPNETNVDQDLTVADDQTRSHRPAHSSGTQTAPIHKKEDNNWQARVDDYNHRILQKKENRKKVAELAKQASAKQANTYEAQNLAATKTAEVEKQKAGKSQKIYLIIGAIIIVVASYLIFYEESKTTSSGIARINLKIPKLGSRTISQKEADQLFRTAVQSLMSDTFVGYASAQTKLVEIVEGTTEHIKSRAVLCLVYRELWPFAKQNENDIKAISIVTQNSKTINVVSPFASFCEVVQFMTQDKLRAARNTIDAIFEKSMSFDLSAVLFLYRAEILEFEKDFLNAAPYYERADTVWKSTTGMDWIKPNYELAEMYYNQNEFTKSNELLRKTLQIDPAHKASKILAGLIQQNGFQQADSALETLSVALALQDRVRPTLEAEGLYTLADILRLKGNKRKALEFAKRSLQLRPDLGKTKKLVADLGGKPTDATALAGAEMMFIADQYARSGDCLSAQAEYKSIFAANPKLAVAAMKAAQCLWKLNQSFESVDYLSKAIKADSKYVSAYVLQADYLSQTYQFSKALSVLANARRVALNNYEVFRGLALVELRRNNYMMAIRYGEQSAKLFDSDLLTYVIMSQAYTRLYFTMTANTTEQGEQKSLAAKNAMSFAAKAIEIDGTNEEAQINYAKTLAAIKSVDSGQQYLFDIISKYASNLEYRLGLADLLKDHERCNEALKYYQQVADIDVKNKKAHLGMGDCYRATGQSDKSIKPYLNAALVDPVDPEAMFQLGKLYLEKNQLALAKERFESVLRSNPNYPRTYFNLGKTAFLSGRYDDAMVYLKEEKKLYPQLSDPYVLSAEIFAAQKMFSECAAEYAYALKLKSQGADVYVKAAECYRKAGSVDIAEDMLALAQERESGYAELWRELGQIYEIKGDLRAAIVSYKKYLGLSPNAKDYRDVDSRIQMLLRRGAF